MEFDTYNAYLICCLEIVLSANWQSTKGDLPANTTGITCYIAIIELLMIRRDVLEVSECHFSGYDIDVMVNFICTA